MIHAEQDIFGVNINLAADKSVVDNIYAGDNVSKLHQT